MFGDWQGINGKDLKTKAIPGKRSRKYGRKKEEDNEMKEVAEARTDLSLINGWMDKSAISNPFWLKLAAKNVRNRKQSGVSSLGYHIRICRLPPVCLYPVSSIFQPSCACHHCPPFSLLSVHSVLSHSYQLLCLQDGSMHIFHFLQSLSPFFVFGDAFWWW